MKYRIVIWVHNTVNDTYECDDLQEAVEWFKDTWYFVWDIGGCAFYVYEDGVELSFDRAYDLGFYG